MQDPKNDLSRHSNHVRCGSNLTSSRRSAPSLHDYRTDMTYVQILQCGVDIDNPRKTDDATVGHQDFEKSSFNLVVGPNG